MALVALPLSQRSVLELESVVRQRLVVQIELSLRLMHNFQIFFHF